MNKPKWLYETLPWIYGGSGLLVMASLQNGVALISGGVLILTGVLVKLMRRRYRRETVEHVVLGTLNLPAPLSWKPALAVGDEVLDLQHRGLFALSNELIKAVARNKPDDVVQAVLQELLALLRAHHELEERVATARGHPLTREHCQQHAALLTRANGLRARFAQAEMDRDALVRYVVMDIVATHVAGEAAELALLLAAPARQQKRELTSA